MDDFTGELVGRGEFEQDRPAVVDIVEDGEGVFDGERGVRELRPGVFIVGLDGGFVFGEAEAKADEGIHVGVGDVVDELAYRPAALAIWGIDFVFTQSSKGGSDVARQVSDFGDRGLAFGILSEWRKGKIPNWVARV